MKERVMKERVMKERVVVVCPGRGSYTQETLGYLKFFRPEMDPFFHFVDEKRLAAGEPSMTQLDAAPSFKSQIHTRGEHASPLIYSCAYADFMAIDRDRYDIVAVTGNSMGWYLALAMAQSLNWEGAFSLIQTMGSMMRTRIIGGQVIYPLIDQTWNEVPERSQMVFGLIEEINQQAGFELYVSIRLGGYVVIAGNGIGLRLLMERLPKLDHYPFQLVNHGAFHTPLMREISETALASLTTDLFSQPKIPLIDGRGHIWSPFTADREELHQYTLGHQVTETYDFTQAMTVALKEFAPDRIVLLGPGNSLGGVIGQVLVKNRWKSIDSKERFQELQNKKPYLISMGLPEIRKSKKMLEKLMTQ